MILYRDILSAAWRVVWRRPWIWLLGFFSVLLINNGEHQLFINAFDRLANPIQNWWWPGTWSNADNISEGGVGVFIATLVIFIILAAILWLAIRSLAALFFASDNVLANRPVDLRSSWTNTRGHFWSVLGLIIIGKGLTVVLLMVAVAPLVLALGVGSNQVTVIIAGLLSFIIFVPLAIIISFATKYGIAYTVLEQQPLGHALINGWKLFWKNWLVSLEIALILFAIGLAVSIGLVIVSMVILIIIISMNTALGTVGVPVLMGVTGFVLLRLLASLVALPLILVIGAMLAVFQTAAWTLVFRHVTTRGLIPKLVRLLRPIYSKIRPNQRAAVIPAFASLATPTRRNTRLRRGSRGR